MQHTWDYQVDNLIQALTRLVSLLGTSDCLAYLGLYFKLFLACLPVFAIGDYSVLAPLPHDLYNASNCLRRYRYVILVFGNSNH